LTRSRRFGADSDVGALSRAVQAGDAGAALGILARPGSAVRLHPLDSTKNLEPMLGELVLEYQSGLRAGTPEERLAALSRFRILCSHRRGPFGVEAVNTFVERHLEAHGKLRLGPEWYDGRPVMITANDYQLSLFNGDVAVIANTGEDGAAVAHFAADESEGHRQLPPSRLPAHETVFAMTVHKSQGSQFERVALVLPETPSPLLTRELVYTAVSRAERGVDVFAPESVLVDAIGRTVERSSGLRDALWLT
jgi:exodeoxyribonuclease V alpha subunit